MTKDKKARQEERKCRTVICELTDLINRNSLENSSNTPDFILAEYLYDCLKSFQKANNKRETWYNKFMKPGQL